jgi:hypothetical protein
VNTEASKVVTPGEQMFLEVTDAARFFAQVRLIAVLDLVLEVEGGVSSMEAPEYCYQQS